MTLSQHSREPVKSSIVERVSQTVTLAALSGGLLAALSHLGFGRDWNSSAKSGIIVAIVVGLTYWLRSARLEKIRARITGHQSVLEFNENARKVLAVVTRDVGFPSAVSGASLPIAAHMILTAKAPGTSEFMLFSTVLVVSAYTLWQWRRLVPHFANLGLSCDRLDRAVYGMAAYGLLVGVGFCGLLIAQSHGFGIPRTDRSTWLFLYNSVGAFAAVLGWLVLKRLSGWVASEYGTSK